MAEPDQPYTFGAALGHDGRTCFRFWAPSQRKVELRIAGEDAIAMSPMGDGWFVAEAACGAGTRYRYHLENGLLVPDPASRAQDGDVHGDSVVVDPHRYRWKTSDWRGRPWQETVIYELHVGLAGGFAGALEKLPDLAALGVTAVELMPIAEFPGSRNWGYDGVLPYAPDNAYGEPDALKALVDHAHELGLMMFLDVVYNHFGPEGNYLAEYAPGFFRQDVLTPWGGAIDFRKFEVRRFFIENALYWIREYRFDGLRFDAVHAIADTEFLDELAREIRAAIPDRHVHLILENERNDADRLENGYDAQWNDDFHNVLHVLLTGERHSYYEDFAEDATAKLARCLKEGFIFQGDGPPHKGGEPRGNPSGHLPTAAFVAFLQNHDQTGNRAFGERLIALAESDALRAATMLLLLSPQIPLIFMGEEEGARSPFLFFTDFENELADAVREGRRKEFAQNPEFADPERRNRIPDPNALSTFETSRPRPGPDAEEWRELYRELLALRHDHIMPRLRGARGLEASVVGEKAVFARWRLDGAALSILVNLGKDTVTADNPADAELLVTTGSRIGAPRSCSVWLQADGT